MSFDKRAVYEAFKGALPADKRDDRFFKVFYSDIRPSPVAVIGLNPGGDPEEPHTLQSASLFYEASEHDYVDCNYVLAKRMRRFLAQSGLAPSVEGVRSIPKTNVVFHRSRKADEIGDWNPLLAASKPHVRAILEHVKPETLVVEGFGTVTRLASQQRWRAAPVAEPVEKRLRLFALQGVSWRDSVQVLALAHPSSGMVHWTEEEWLVAIKVVRERLGPPQPPVAPRGPIVRRRGVE